jgi:hypothetical protein
VTSIGSLLGHVAGLLEIAGVPYMVAGSFASAFYSTPRTTLDVDIVIDPRPASLEAFVSSLDSVRFYVDDEVARDALRRRSMFNIIDSDTGWKVDLIIRKARAFSVEEMARRRPVQLFGASVYVASPEDVVVSKLEWAKASGSERQLRDVAEVLAGQPELDTAYIERWVDELGLGAEWAAAQADVLG